jgi:hypothetical protein
VASYLLKLLIKENKDMRVKLSYTVDAESVLKEAAKLIGLQGDDMQQAVTLFQEVQKELRGDLDPENGIVNINRAHEMVAELREALLLVDRRLEEVDEIIKGYDEYLRTNRTPTPNPMPGYGPADDEEPELFGAD